MKRFVLLILMICAFAPAQAQIKVNDSTRVYDIVSDADTFYLFQTPKPAITPGLCWFGGLYGGVTLQEYVVPDTVTVYGVAITFKNLFGPVYDTVTGYRALLMNGRQHSELPNPNYYTMQLVDSVSLDRSHPRFCWFKYTYEENGKEEYLLTPCFEFYFDTPKKINRISDTFYVGRYIVDGSFNSFVPREFGGNYSSSLPCHMWNGLGYTGNENVYYHLLGGGSYEYMWGVYFPIIGFRCGSMPYYSLDTYAGDSAILRWRNAELGTLYNVRLVGGDGSDTTFVTADTTITLSNLADTVHYNVMLRRQCHLATSNYDTTVYSDWLSYISFSNGVVDTTGGSGSGGGGTEGIGDVVDHGLHVTALEGRIVVQGLAAGQRAEVYDMLGRRVVELAADGRTEALPQGVYMVRTGQSRARKVVVLR